MMCNSLPIIASDIGEIPSIIGQGTDSAGIIIPRTSSGINEDELYAASLRFLDCDTRTAFAENSRRRYLENFSIVKMVDVIIRVDGIEENVDYVQKCQI